jgi:hypothetical protein
MSCPIHFLKSNFSSTASEERNKSSEAHAHWGIYAAIAILSTKRCSTSVEGLKVAGSALLMVS